MVSKIFIAVLGMGLLSAIVAHPIRHCSRRTAELDESILSAKSAKSVSSKSKGMSKKKMGKKAHYFQNHNIACQVLKSMCDSCENEKVDNDTVALISSDQRDGNATEHCFVEKLQLIKS